MACIFSIAVCDEAVKSATSFLISGDASPVPISRVQYQVPMERQLVKPLPAAPPGGRKEITICPRSPRMGGMSSSSLTPFISPAVHCHWLLPDWIGLMSGEFRNSALYSQPGGSWIE